MWGSPTAEALTATALGMVKRSTLHPCIRQEPRPRAAQPNVSCANSMRLRARRADDRPRSPANEGRTNRRVASSSSCSSTWARANSVCAQTARAPSRRAGRGRAGSRSASRAWRSAPRSSITARFALTSTTRGASRRARPRARRRFRSVGPGERRPRATRRGRARARRVVMSPVDGVRLVGKPEPRCVGRGASDVDLRQERHLDRLERREVVGAIRRAGSASLSHRGVHPPDPRRPGRRPSHGARRAVEHREDRRARSLAPPLDQREREGPPERFAPVRRRHVAEHGRRRLRELGAGDELRALRQHERGVIGEQPDELLAVLAQGVAPHERTLAEEVALRRCSRSTTMPRSSGVCVPSVSWPTITKPFSARSTCIASVP